MSMNPTKRRWLVAIYILGCTLVMLYLCFPSEALRVYASNRLSAGLPGLAILVGEVRPALPADIVLRDVRVSRGEQTLAVIDRLRVQPDLPSLLQTRTGYDLSGSIGGGELSGRAEIDSTGPRPKIIGNCQINGVSLQQLAELRGPYGSKLSGQVNGNLTASEAGAVTGKFNVTNAKIELPSPVFNQKEFSFQTVYADLNFQNQTLLLRRGRLKGAELDAEISGTIDLGQPPGANALNLRGRMTPHQAFMAQVQDGIPPNLLRRRTAIPFKIRGTLDAPGFSLN